MFKNTLFRTLVAVSVILYAGNYNLFATTDDLISELQEEPIPAAGYQVGDLVSNFTLPATDGKAVALSSYLSGKGLIVVFTGNQCPFAKVYEDRIVDLDRKFSSKGYPVLAINPGDPKTSDSESLANMAERARTKAFSFAYLSDENQVVAKAFGATKTPQVYLLKNNGGKMVVQYIGAIDDSPQEASGANKRYVEEAINNLLAGQPPTTVTTRPIGCTIKFKN